MYSRSTGGIESDGQLKKFEEQYSSQFSKPKEEPLPPQPESIKECASKPKMGLFDKAKDLIGSLKMDDLILIAIGVLLLIDSDEDNDIIIVFIIALLFF
ncbi:MAG: hypothetical protein RRY76_00025 [Clostridia bacterium]